MTAKKDPADVLSDVIARALAQVRGLDGADVTRLVERIRQALPEDPAAREAAAAEIQSVVELFAKTGAALGGALVAFREPLMKAMQGAEVQKATEALRSMLDWLRNPTPEQAAHAKSVVGELEGSLAAKPPEDPAEAEKRRAEIKAQVTASLDQIFGRNKNLN